MSAEAGTEVEAQAGAPATGGDAPPSELESAMLTVAMFGGLVVFGAGCFLMGGFG